MVTIINDFTACQTDDVQASTYTRQHHPRRSGRGQGLMPWTADATYVFAKASHFTLERMSVPLG
jgi:hypothetical protein